MSKKLFLGAIVAALGGLLFGFDTAVISGAEQSIKEVFGLDSFQHGFTNAIALIGTIIGAMFAGKPGDRFGRRNSLIVLAIFYAVSAIGCALTVSWEAFIFYRFLGGLGVGASSVLGPMYISEIAPAAFRGRLVGLFQFNIVFGILLAFLSNFVINLNIEVDAWRWMLGVEAVPAVLFLGLLFLIPKSPRWLVKMDRNAEAFFVLEKLGNKLPQKTLQSIKDSLREDRQLGHVKLFSKKYSYPLLLAFLLATFNQFSGINAIMYYAPRIFGMTGLAEDTAFLQAIAIGLTNMVFTVIAMSIIDKFGRKKLLIVGSVGMIIFLSLTAWSFHVQNFSGYGVLVYLIGFIASFAFSQGAVIWVFISEIFPNAVRASGQAFGTFVHWFWAAVMTWTFPMVAELEIGGTLAFGFFALAMGLHLVFAIKMLPETKGKSLEELQEELVKKEDKILEVNGFG
ncbi:sugar porter family MFS transporter [Echinicola jeungdonensis]|uniref:Sugar porter family MFS transporter n=1 Tax=Echinicola jeungdonensis TaxID=709343 RepID=A0ABV5JAY0_9BACT|nr:sugar porter family MFS transporter [Echinicola jeungdonensis]MDN3670475.1 sugar porter family MFS transporter [Echinicola jeungdonensis]